MRREPASPYSDLPGSCELSHPASAPARSVASPTRPFAPPCLGTALAPQHVGSVTQPEIEPKSPALNTQSPTTGYQVTNYLPESKPSGG
ncbi:hypothetical protein JEQ12_009620 [Ovis aries]|uniref:Uncharacterized protein n=1 Tax=Ovis aries TaxID=9940 RepID=A0A836AB86_SHEEP|nr:hypothetical protein JEQ12_009620 [Ovis aries]